MQQIFNTVLRNQDDVWAEISLGVVFLSKMDCCFGEVACSIKAVLC